MVRRQWTVAEIDAVRDRYQAGDVASIARDLARSVSSVHCKAFKLGLRKERMPASKVCPRCRVSKPRKTEFYERGNGSHGKRTESYCKACCREIMKLNPPPPERSRANYYKHGEKRRAEMRAKSRKEARTLAPTYIAKALTMRRVEIPQELLEMKQQQLTIFRMARNLRKATNESSKDTDRISQQHGRGRNTGRPAQDRGE